MENDEVFEVNGSTDAAVSNVLEKGRYKFVVLDASNFISQNQNKCVKITLSVGKGKVYDNLLIEGQMSWKWRQFLFAIGIRDKRQAFSVPRSKIVGAEGLVDIGIKDRMLDDGTTVKENKVSSYSPIEQEAAPMTGVPSEIEPEPEATDKAPAHTDDDL